ncbi:hypothetical protein BFP70_08570 [Thioclava sp. SK-1]|nr:hypothetical protein BFP70_08570 [Thioclava sp. SK-1]
MRHIIRIWAHHKILSIVFVVAVTLTATYAVRTIDHALYWSDPKNVERAPEAWMTTGYLARSWNVDRNDVANVLQVDPHKKQRIKDIARKRDIPVEVLLNELRMALPNLPDMSKHGTSTKDRKE